MEFEAWAVAEGFDLSTLNDKAKGRLQAQWRAEQRSTSGGDDDLAGSERLKAAVEREWKPDPKNPAEQATGVDIKGAFAPMRAEQARQEQITLLGVKYGQANPSNLEACESIVSEAIEKKWNVTETELRLIRAARPGAPMTVRRDDEREVSGKVIEAAVCVAGGLSTVEKEYDARTLEAAHQNFRGGLGLADLIGTFARKNGYRGGSLKSNLRGNLAAAFGADGNTPDLRAGQAGPSTYSLPNILSNVANKFLRQSFMAVDDAWRMLAAIRTFNDFKATSTVALTGGLMYSLVPRGGELKHGDLGELAYPNQADTYGKMLGIDRRDLINDDLGALTGASSRLGRGGALKLNDKFWSIFLNNSTFFTSGHTNVSTGAGSALGIAGLTAADVVFTAQTDPDGTPLAAKAQILLVPTALRILALQLMSSTALTGTTTANSLLPANNPFAGAYRVVSSPYMSNSSYTGFSAAAWYLLADPNDMPVIEVGFLNGQQTPIVETSDMDWNTLGIAMRGYFDFGIALQEYRGGVRSAGS